MKKMLMIVAVAAAVMAANTGLPVYADLIDEPRGEMFIDDLDDDDSEVSEDVGVGYGTEVSGQLISESPSARGNDYLIPAALSVAAAALSGALIFGLKRKK